MIYLLTQMILVLVLAAVAGGAVGWLLQRARAGREDEALRETIVRQHHQLRHAETDVAMLTDDFDDLKQRSQTEIESLRRETRRLPTLLQNLDKSQTLVRQLMQKHEAQLREAAQQNEALRARVADGEEREAAFARTRSELESARAELRRLRAGGPATAEVGTAVPSATASAVALAVTEPESAPPATSTPVAGTDLPDAAPATGTVRPAPAAAGDGASAFVETGVPAVEPDPDGAADAASGSRDAGPAAGAADDSDADDTDDRAEADATVAIAVADDPIEIPGVSEAVLEATAAANAASRASASDFGEFDGSDPYDDELDDDVEPGDDDDEDEDEDDLLDESVELLFEPVDRHDDLQRIFGIGPVTERALNRLGITSYHQIAELQRHEVEQIADALQIYPGRIERDDWVGNARRQLEDVLEEL